MRRAFRIQPATDSSSVLTATHAGYAAYAAESGVALAAVSIALRWRL
jgi:hypothetical protein